MAGARNGNDLLEVGYIEIAHSPGKNFAGLQQRVEGRNGFFQFDPAAPVQQVAIEPIGPQACQRFLAGGERAAHRGIARQYLGHEKHFVAPSLDRRGDEFFSRSGAVHFRGVDMRQPQIQPAAQRRRGSGGRGIVDFPGSLADGRDIASGGAEQTPGVGDSHGV